MRHSNRARPLRGFIARVGQTVVRRGLIGPDDVVLAALSAGPDSTALVAALAALRDARRVGPVHALHVDHGLRAGGELDAECARETCARLGVPFESVRVAVEPGNLQASARRARYRALRAAAARAGAARIATGHTRTDQAETFVMRALRGAGARGLSAIPPRRGAIVRPLIDVGREEVLAYLAAEKLRWREDPTNGSPRFARNAIRLEVMPVLRGLAPRVEAALARAADLLRDDERALVRRARALASPDGSIPIARLLRAPRAVRRRAVRELWREAARGAAALPADQVEAVVALCRRGRAGRLSLPGRREARVARGRLTLAAPLAAPPPRAAVIVDGPGAYPVGELTVEVAASGAAGAVPWPLVLRGRLPGDRLRPERGRGGKKLKAWLIDRKIPREQRDALVVLADGDGNVFALPELGIRSAAAGSLCVTVRRGPVR